MSTVQIQLDAQQRQTILDAFENIAQALATAKQEVTKNASKHTIKVGKRRLSFISDSLKLATVNQALVPQYYTLNDVVELKQQDEALRDIEIRALNLVQDIKSINTVARPSLFQVARAIYRTCKGAAIDGISGTQEAYSTLSDYFHRPKSSSTETDSGSDIGDLPDGSQVDEEGIS